MSMIYPDTRDHRRIYNSDAKTLLQNWMEERAAEKFDKLPDEKNLVPAKHFKEGHKGLLTVKDDLAKKTTYKDDYLIRSNYDPNSEAKGVRYKMTEQIVKKQLLDEMENEENLKNDYYDEPTSYVSEVHEKFSVPGFVSLPPKPIASHNVYSEMPVSFWSEHRNKAHGVTQFKTLDSPFRRNAAFSTPGAESYDQAKPGDLENYPYMSQKTNNSAAIN